MNTQTKWFERKFDFSVEQNIFPSVIRRLGDTPGRLEEIIQSVSGDALHVKIDGRWSVKENIGHLIDLEPLWVGRLDDILNGETYLRTADLQNRKTDQANHNASGLRSLLQGFRAARNNTVHRLLQLTEKEIYSAALHPRLKTPMRMMDHFYFVAEHDDHHLVAITSILQTFLINE